MKKETLTTSGEKGKDFFEQTAGLKNEPGKFSAKIIEKYLSNTPLGIIVTDQDQRVIRWSSEAEKIFGWNQQEILGRKFDDIPLHCTNDLLVLNDKASLVFNKSGINVTRNNTKSGRLIDCVWYNSALTDCNGNIESVLLLVDDVTKQKQAERILIANEEKYRLLFDRMSEGFAMLEIIYDNDENPSDFILISANPSFEKHTGIKLRDNTGKSLTEFFPPEEKYWLDICHKTALTGKTVDYENFSPTLDRYFRLNTFCPQNGYIAAIVEDITERKRAEKELHESKKKLELALDSAHIGIWEWDMGTNTMKWDRRMETIFGFHNGKFNKTFPAFENFIHEEDITHFRNSINLSLKNNLPLETAFRSKPYKGESKYIVTKAIVLTDKFGKTAGLTGVCYDLTGMQKGTEDIMVKLNDELLRSNLELQQFAYVASHDLQEPLRMVSSFTQLLAQKYGDKLDSDAREYIKFAVDGSKRMYELINGLLAYSSVQTKGKEFLPVNMNSVIQQVLRNLKLYIRETNARIMCNDIHWVLADEAQMIQLIQNLVTNAIKFSRSAPKVIISSKRMKDYIKFAIKDEGIGIEQQYFEKIFKIFQRLDPSRHKGTGIGLAVCKRIVERHGGKIWITSTPGKGSTFHFTIPATSIQIDEPRIPFL